MSSSSQLENLLIAERDRLTSLGFDQMTVEFIIGLYRENEQLSLGDIDDDVLKMLLQLGPKKAQNALTEFAISTRPNSCSPSRLSNKSKYLREIIAVIRSAKYDTGDDQNICSNPLKTEKPASPKAEIPASQSSHQDLPRRTHKRRSDDDEFEGRSNGIPQNQRLFVSNIPKNKDKYELFNEFSKHSTGLVDVIIYCSPDDKKKNRGFCFLDYDSHKNASSAKKKLGAGRPGVWNCDIIVDWADPLEEPDEETMSKVKVLYVRNLTQRATEDDIRDLFQEYGVVERVKKIKDYAFVHFTTRDNTIRALDACQGMDLCGAPMEITLAKPPSDKRKKEEILRKREIRMTSLMHDRGRYWNTSVHGTQRSSSLSRSSTNTSFDYNLARLQQPQQMPLLALAGLGSTAIIPPGGPPQSLAMNMHSSGQLQVSYPELLNAADFWDDFNELDMACSPLAPAAVPVPVAAAAVAAGVPVAPNAAFPFQPFFQQREAFDFMQNFLCAQQFQQANALDLHHDAGHHLSRGARVGAHQRG
ncbi:unnamed protein product [Notodromas monacha]|uniref:RRM domain-containing protein n=1 Tax=Notodromas monacha TaxID=399045 RepID=A0A7R9GCG6_9CRUS|nr:unnamed protein product [Notodromas monacha]CAG0915958.1 unnamed protein product [Notodromas monacha]